MEAIYLCADGLARRQRAALESSEESDAVAITGRIAIGDLLPGSRYRIVEKLGEGGMGVVYAAEHVDIGRRVAIKILRPEIADDSEALDRFRQEARAACRSGSPYTCDVTDWGELPDGRVFFVMEYVDGRTLGGVLREQTRLTPARCIPILRQMAKALAAVHRRGLVHLDTKPDNVLLTATGEREDAVKIVDFGVAAALGAGAGVSRMLGTPEYMAPERIAAEGCDQRADVYSLGAMAYEMLSGSVPLQGETSYETLDMQISRRPVRLDERALEPPVPRELGAVVMQMLEKEPARRPASMAEVEALLLEAQIAAHLRTPWDDLPLPAMAPSRAARIARGLERPPARARAGAVGAVLAIAVLGCSALAGAFRPQGRALGSAGRLEMDKAVAATTTPPPAVPRHNGGLDRPEPSSPLRTTTEARRAQPTRSTEADERRLGRDSSFVRLTIGRGHAAMEKGRIDVAAAQFRQALTADPHSAEALSGLAAVQFERANYDEAQALARRAVRFGHHTAGNFIVLGSASMRLACYGEAVRAFERARLLDRKRDGLAQSLERARDMARR